MSKNERIVFSTRMHLTLTRAQSDRQMETISTSSVSIMFITLTSHWTQGGGYFWNSFVDKLTPHPAFTNSS